jgi:hypothetical protein
MMTQAMLPTLTLKDILFVQHFNTDQAILLFFLPNDLNQLQQIYFNQVAMVVSKILIYTPIFTLHINALEIIWLAHFNI